MSGQAVKLQHVVAVDADEPTGGQAVELVRFVDAAGKPVAAPGGGSELPPPPADAGAYDLRVIVDPDGGATYAWIAAE